MKILMLGIGDDILHQPVGDEIDRHIEYARRIQGQVHLLTYSPAHRQLAPRQIEQQVFLYPTHSRNQLTYPVDAYRQAATLCQRVRFDLIYTQDPFGTALVGNWLHRRFKMPYIIGNHADFIDNPYWIAERPLFFGLLNRLGKHNLPKAQAWRVVNEHQKQVYIEQLHLPAERIYVRNTPVNMERFLRAERAAGNVLRQKIGIAADAPVVLWIGRPVRFKRLPILCQAFRGVLDEFPAAKLVLVGKRKFLQEDLDAEIARLSLYSSVIWMGEGADHTDIPAYYQMADVYVQSSQYEGCCKTIIEAAASGLPVVSTDMAAYGTQRLILPDDTGLLVSVDAVAELRDALLGLLRNPSHAQAMGQKARERARQVFDREHNIGALIAMWQTVAQEFRMGM
jgi:1,2-diacylglycerol 3-alpha-glucosyltransferase